MKNMDCELVEHGLHGWATTPGGNTYHQSHVAVQKTTAVNLKVDILVAEAMDVLYEETEMKTVARQLGVNSAPWLPARPPEWPNEPQRGQQGRPLLHFEGQPAYQLGFQTKGNSSDLVFFAKWQTSKAIGHRKLPEIVWKHLYNHF